MHLSQVASGTDWIKLHGELAELELHGRKIAVNHYPEIGRALANSGSYDLVCYGHDHAAHEETVAKTLLLNPGEIMGLNGRRTFVKIDLADMSLEWIELK
jgi:hypothetical protein